MDEPTTPEEQLSGMGEQIDPSEQVSTTGEQKEFKRFTPGYIKEMTEAERVELMRELGAKGGEASGQARLVATEATRQRDEGIRVRLAAIQVNKGVTHLDDKIEWLSEAARIYQSYGLSNRVIDMDKMLTTMVAEKTKIQVMLEGQVMTDTIWAGVAEIVQTTVTDEVAKQTLLTKIHDYLSALIKEALATKGTK